MSDNTEQMSPDASPGEASPKTGVRRVNNWPMYIIAAVLGLFLVIMMLVAADRSAQQNAPGERDKEQAGNTSIYANEIAGGQKEGFIPAIKAKTTEVGAASEVMPLVGSVDQLATVDVEEAEKEELQPQHADSTGLVLPYNPNRPPLKANRSLTPPRENDDEAQRIRIAKLQMLQEAIKAKTGVQTIAPRSNSDTSQNVGRRPETRSEMLGEIARVRQQIASNRTNDPTAAYQARRAQIEEMRNTGSIGSGNSRGTNSPMLMQMSSDSDGYSQFNGEGDDRWQLNSQIQSPRTPYELRAGFVIPATLISGINSDLPGQIIAQVSQSVSDTSTGKYELIPQGSRLVGSYSSEVAYGQDRVLVAWQRIIFPDGKAMDIGSMPGADAAGYSGFHDQVNNHFLRIFGSAFLMSGITAGVTLSQDNDDEDDNSRRAGNALSEALGQQLGQVAVEMIRKNMNIAPTLEIRPGYRFNVVVTKDMTFSKPYQPFDY
ncbi:TrbI/VirB10 family protein [Marinobacter sp.]|uniref:TrbI/VirB10 family protein n=1 Tax=Marinobacter sp. TaxID=50741 RepID=UPI003A8D7CF3